MNDNVKIAHLRPRLLAAVRRTAAPREIPNVFRSALDLVWAFSPGAGGDGAGRQVRLRFVGSEALAHGVVHMRYAVEAS